MLKICGTTLIDDKRPPQTECQHIPDQITPVTASGDTKKIFTEITFLFALPSGVHLSDSFPAGISACSSSL